MNILPGYCSPAPPFGIPDPSMSGFSCIIASNYTRLSTCCASNPVQAYDSNSCHNWCHVPTNLTTTYNTSSSPFASTYAKDDSGTEAVWASMRACLEDDGGPPVILLGCQNNTEQNAPKPRATSTFDSTAYCATAVPSIVAPAIDPFPGCLLRRGLKNTGALARCCTPSPVQWSIRRCYEYCLLPMGTGFRGTGNLTLDEAVGSFRTCMVEQGGEDVFDGLHCRANTSILDLKAWMDTTRTYLTGEAAKRATGGQLLDILVAALCLWAGW